MQFNPNSHHNSNFRTPLTSLPNDLKNSVKRKPLQTLKTVNDSKLNSNIRNEKDFIEDKENMITEKKSEFDIYEDVTPWNENTLKVLKNFAFTFPSYPRYTAQNNENDCYSYEKSFTTEEKKEKMEDDDASTLVSEGDEGAEELKNLVDEDNDFEPLSFMW